MESILDLGKIEGKLYKGGSGSGVNYSPLRSSREFLSGGGYASGPVPFIQKDDANAGAIKSGGTTRRAAKMVILNIDHGDIQEFIQCKARAEKMVQALIAAGFDSDFRARGGAYDSIPFQNGNNTVRVTREFMQAVRDGKPWNLLARDGRVLETVDARKLWTSIAEAAHACGCPGLHFDDEINKWHTTPKHGRINGSNPCCFTGDTLVDTSEGALSFNELMRMEANNEPLPLAFSFSTETNMPVLRPITRVWQAGVSKKLATVVTERGITLRCTPEHRFMLRNGTYVEAQRLEPGMRLRKIGRWTNTQRSNRNYLNLRATQACANGTIVQARWMWEQVHGEIPNGVDVHHLNGNPTDDRLSNLSLVDALSHRAEHSVGSANARFIDVEPRLLVEAWEDIETENPGRPVSISRWNAYVRKNFLVGFIPIANIRGIRGMSWTEFASWIEQNRSVVNDAVKSVSVEDAEEPVFDLEVEGTHNFGVRDASSVHSVIVHNSEYMSHDDSACNLASLNICKCLHPDLSLDVDAFNHTVDIIFLGQDIVVDMAAYPTEKIQKNASDYRQIGLGYANLGAWFMQQGLPYDSDEARALAAQITALLTGRAYFRSAEIAAWKGPFRMFLDNTDSMMAVMRMHQHALADIDNKTNPIFQAAQENWRNVLAFGTMYGYRNSQATVIAPTGTIAFMMDCDTTGIEPEIALVKTKLLVGGGKMRIVNQCVPRALAQLHCYRQNEIDSITEYVLKNGSVVNSGLKPEHYSIFDGAFAESVGGRFLRPEAHILMLAAVQPFVSGSISKTVNVPGDATVADIEKLYMLAYDKNLKCVAIYRDGAKQTQPLKSVSVAGPPPAVRHKLPDTRQSVTHKFDSTGQFSNWLKHSSKTFARCEKRIEDQALNYASMIRADYICCGHTHTAKELKTDTVTYYNSGCWTQDHCTYLKIVDGKITIEAF
jgi:ribonucleotide reductase alpha subunit